MPADRVALLPKAGILSTRYDPPINRNGASETGLCKSLPSCAQVRMFNTCGAGGHDC